MLNVFHSLQPKTRILRMVGSPLKSSMKYYVVSHPEHCLLRTLGQRALKTWRKHQRMSDPKSPPCASQRHHPLCSIILIPRPEKDIIHISHSNHLSPMNKNHDQTGSIPQSCITLVRYFQKFLGDCLKPYKL